MSRFRPALLAWKVPDRPSAEVVERRYHAPQRCRSRTLLQAETLPVSGRTTD